MDVGDIFRRVKNDPAKLINVDCRSGEDDTGILGSDAVGLAIGFSLAVNHRRVVVDDDLAGLAEDVCAESNAELAASSYCECMSGGAENRSGNDCKEGMRL